MIATKPPMIDAMIIPVNFPLEDELGRLGLGSSSGIIGLIGCGFVERDTVVDTAVDVVGETVVDSVVVCVVGSVVVGGHRSPSQSICTASDK